MFKLTFAILFAGLFQQALLAPNHQKAGSLNVLVTMTDSNAQLVADLTTQIFSDRVERLTTVYNTLKPFATESQKNVKKVLDDAQQPFESIWTTNQVIIRNTNLDMVLELAKMPEVSSIEEEQFFPLDEPIDPQYHDNLPPPNEDEVQWGVLEVQAPKVWAEGNRGESIVICTIDTGVRGTHEALKDNFVGSHGWYDPGKKTAEPNDGNGHGTHTTGNIAGTFRNIGVAPAAKWMACKGCATSSCSQLDLLGCGAFVACPTDANGENADCSKAPHLVSNSWGGGRGNTWYQATINTWHAAGVIPLFSQGNSGPSCGSANSPGDEELVIGVGSTTIDNELSYFSSVGPTLNGARIKPDVAAPGSNVFSSHHLSDTAYATMSGTSMASPHAAGVVALMLAESPDVDMDYDLVKLALTQGSQKTETLGKTCADIPDTQYPNHQVGHGRVDAFESVRSFQKLRKQ